MNAVNFPHTQPYESPNADALATFVAAQNINLYQAQLATGTPPDKRKILLELLANECAKLPKSVRRRVTGSR